MTTHIQYIMMYFDNIYDNVKEKAGRWRWQHRTEPDGVKWPM